MFKHQFKSIYGMLAAALMIITFQSCQKDQTKFDTEGDNHALLTSKFKNYELTEVKNFSELYSLAQSEPSNPVSINFNLKSHPDWKFSLTMDQFNKDIFDNTEFYNLDGNNNQTTVQLDRVYGLSGELPGAEHKSLLLFNKDYFEGEIIDGDQIYYIEQAKKYDPSLGDNVYIVYNESDVIDQNHEHCNDVGDSQKMFEGATDDASQARLAGHTKKADVAYIGDYQLYRKYGSSSSAHNYMYYRMVYASKRYYDYNRVNLELRKRYGGLYTSSGGGQPTSYWNANTFLNEWRNYYNSSWFRNKNADVHYLFTGYNIGGNIVGMAWVGTICVNRAYSFGFGQHLWSTTKANDLMAHEIGHIFGCSHVNGYNFMAPSLSTSNSTMASYTRSQINWMLANQSSCLSY